MENRPIYKTAEDIGIEQWEHDGLVALVGPLSREELRLNMQREFVKDKCGTVCCIGGWVAVRENKNPSDYVQYRQHDNDISELYWPRKDRRGYDAKPSQAARAIVNFLTLGDPRWADVMAGA